MLKSKNRRHSVIIQLLILLTLFAFSTAQQTHLQTARSFLERDDYMNAIKEADLAVLEDPSNSSALLIRGVSKFFLGYYDGASVDLDNAIQIAPELDVAYFFRGQTYNSKNEPLRAISDFTKALELGSKRNLLYRFRGWAHHELANYSQAKSDYLKYIELSPDDAEGYKLLGLNFLATGEYVSGIDFSQKSYSLRNNGGTLENIGWGYYGLGKYAEAISACTQALESRPNLVWAHLILALSYEAQSDAGRAQQYFQSYIAVDPTQEFNKRYFNINLYDRPKTIKISTSSKSLNLRGKKIAVVEFSVLGDIELNDAGIIVAEWFTSSLQQEAVFKVYARLSLTSLIEEHKLELTGLFDENTVAQVGNLHGLDAIVTGSIIKFDNILSITVKLIDTETAEIIKSVSSKSGSIKDVPVILDQLARSLANN
jgi:tetratricopeptide (TPR) repeat protein